MIWWGGSYPDLDGLTRAGEGTMNGFLGITFTDVGPDWLRAAMPVTTKTHQPFGRLHGGASVALAETVGSSAGLLVVNPAKFAVVGMEINANHIRPAFDGFVHSTATAESLGRTTQIWTIRVENDDGKLICLSRLTTAVISIERV